MAKAKKTNPANKERTHENPYATWTDPRTGWKYSLLKSWQAANKGAYARWMMNVVGYANDTGDVYVHEMLHGIVQASDLQVDTTIWPDNQAFIAWATQ